MDVETCNLMCVLFGIMIASISDDLDLTFCRNIFQVILDGNMHVKNQHNLELEV